MTTWRRERRAGEVLLLALLLGSMFAGCDDHDEPISPQRTGDVSARGGSADGGFGGGASSAAGAAGAANAGGAVGRGAAGGPGAAGIAPGALTRCPIGVGSGEPGLVDDFEDGDDRILEQDERFGYWWAERDEGTITVAAEETTDAATGEYALHATASGISGWGAVFGATLHGDESAGCVYDASAYTGVRFKARGSVNTRLEVLSANLVPVESGGTCETNCYDAHGATVLLTDDWKTHTLWFEDLGQSGWGSAGDLDLSQVQVLQWKTETAGDWEIWLDDVELITEPKLGLADTVTLTVSDTPQRYPELGLGLNWWSWVEDWGVTVSGTEDLVAPIAPGTLRLGGTYPDTSSASPFSTDVMSAGVAYAREVGAEPIVQIPVVAAADGSPATAENAAAIVAELNETEALDVKYFCIGNEPDLYAEQGVMPDSWTASEYCKTFKAFAEAMKAVDPTVKVIGPELSWKYQSGGDDDWFTPFVEECGAAADILSIHRYPFNAEQSTALNAMADGPSYRALLQRLRQTMDDGGLQDKPLAVTEANVTWDDEPGRPVLDAAPGTLAAAVWLADNLGISLEEDVFTTDYWSIREEWSLGMIDEDTPRPMYWALRLFGEHFGPERVAVGKTLSDISVYASRDSERRLTTAIVLNRDDVPHSITLDVEGLEEAPDPVVRDTPPLSITAIVFEDGEPSAQIWTYGAEEAAAQEGPTQLQ